MQEEKIKLKKEKKKKNNHGKKKLKKKSKINNKRKTLGIIILIILSIFLLIILSIIFILNFYKLFSNYLKIITQNKEIINDLKDAENKIKNETQNINETKMVNNELINNIIKEDTTVNMKEIKEKILEEIKEMKKFIKLIINGKLINPNEIFYKSENPKISIVISVYNGEPYLKNALLSIQNQDFKDIEVIMIDDCSKDNSVNLIKELMLTDPRIVLYQNEENRGALYTKTKGILNSKGKYVMTLDEDDMYSHREAFSTLYEEAERNNLDILGFASFTTNRHIGRKVPVYKYIETPILFQPNITKRMYDYNNDGTVRRVGDVIWSYIFRTDLFIKTIKQIETKYFTIKMNVHDDFLLFFLLTRNAYNLKQIKRIFYLKITWRKNSKIEFRLNEKNKNKENLNCMAYLYYIEMILIKTDNTISDKKIPSFELDYFYLNHPCRNNTYVREKGISICKQFLENKYIEKDIKDKILIFLNETKIDYKI